ncbi:hypothetical protein HOY82DRAFT_536694 [Tuber indicum]|nr:hypothetical protein HOY82DRAFT_536694 [Tuber indicum]
MSNPDPLFKKLWFIALEKSIEEGMFSQDQLLEIKKREEDHNKQLEVSQELASTLPDSSIIDCGKPPVDDTCQAQSNDLDIIARIAADEKFLRWKAEMVQKEATRDALTIRKKLNMESKQQSPRTNTTFHSNANTAVSGSLAITSHGGTSFSSVNYPISENKPSSLSFSNIESYIKILESNPIFSASRTPARHSSETRRHPRCIRVNLGNYSGFKLADNQFENVRKRNSKDVEQGVCQPKYPSPDINSGVDTT